MLQADDQSPRHRFIHRITFIVIAQVMLFLTNPLSAAEPVFDVADHKGKIVYVDFWASWCTPCRVSFPFMAKLKEEFGDNLVIAAVNLDKSRADADKFLVDMDVNFGIYYDPEAGLAETFEVKGMPSSYLFDRNGQPIGSHVGFRKKDEAKLFAAIGAAIGATAATTEAQE